MIFETINGKITQALKAKDNLRLSTLRMLSSALNYEKIALQKDLNEEDEIRVVRRELKKRIDAIEALKNAKGKVTSSSKEDLEKKLQREESELDILREYLPQELAEKDLIVLVKQSIKETNASDIKDMGRVIGLVMTKAKGRADGSKVSELVKKLL